MNIARGTTSAQAGERRSRAQTQHQLLLEGLIDLEENIDETVNVTIALDLILEAGGYAGELCKEEVRAAAHIASQAVSLAKLLRADMTALLKSMGASTGQGAGA